VSVTDNNDPASTVMLGPVTTTNVHSAIFSMHKRAGSNALYHLSDNNHFRLEILMRSTSQMVKFARESCNDACH
jgi:hypothetical protein